MEIRGIEVVKPIGKDKNATQIILGCSRKGVEPVITENDLQITKISSNSFIY